MIQLLYSHFSQPLSQEKLDRYGALVSFDAAFQIDRYRRWQDAQAHLLGRLLLVQGLRNWGVVGQDIPSLRYSSFQKPYFEQAPDFSIAHSGEYVLCALSDQGPVGVDIEKIRPIDLSSMQFSFSEEEWAAITAAEHPTEWLFRVWTQKEAVMKADGRGMSVAEQITIQELQAQVGEAVWHLKALTIDADYYAHLASSQPINHPISIIPLNF